MTDPPIEDGLPDARSNRLEQLAVVAAAASFFALLFFRDGAPVYGRDKVGGAFILDEPARVLAGEVMYRDFFELLGPGIVYWHAALFRTLGANMSVLGFEVVGLGMSLTWSIHRLSSWVVRSRLRLLPPLAFATLSYGQHLMTADHKLFALQYGLLALLLLARAPATHGRTFAAGLALGVSLLFTQDLGLGMTLGAASFVGLRSGIRGRPFVTLLTGCALTAASGYGYFAWKAGAGVVLYDCLLFPLLEYKRMFPFVVRRGFDGSPVDVARLVLGLGSVLCALGFVLSTSLRRLIAPRRTRQAEVAWLTATAGAGLFVASGHRGLDIVTLPFACALLLLLLAAALEATCRQPRWLWRAAGFGVAGTIGFGSLARGWQQVSSVQWSDGWTRQQSRAGAFWTRQPMPELRWLEDNATTGSDVLLLPAKGGYYFMTRTRNPTAFPYLLEQNTPAQVRQALAEIDARGPRVGLWDEAYLIRRGGTILPSLLRAVLARYTAEPMPNGVLLLRLAGAPSPQEEQARVAQPSQ